MCQLINHTGRCTIGKCTAVMLALAFAQTLLGETAVCRGGTVLAGWDLLDTGSETSLLIGTQNVHFKGVPIVNFDFGGSIGTKYVGSTDTIVHRLAPATAPNGDPSGFSIPIQIVALRLMSLEPVVAAGNQIVFATLSAAPASGGNPGASTNPVPPAKGLNIAFNPGDTGGQFDSFFDVFFDLRINDVNGPIVVAGLQKTFTLLNQDWTHAAPAGANLVPGVNYLLNGVNTDQDFWIQGVALHQTNDGTHLVIPNPEPGTVAIAGLVALVGFGCHVRRNRRKTLDATTSPSGRC